MPRAFIVFECNRRLIANKRTKESKNHTTCMHVIFAFFCLIGAQFVMIICVFFTTEACLFQVA